MKYVWSVLAGSAALMLVGCRPELAREKFGDDDAEWSTRLKENYGGYQAPRTYAPALIDKYERMPANQQPVKDDQSVKEAETKVTDAPVTEDVVPEPAAVKAPEKTVPAAAPAATAPAAESAAVVTEPAVKGELYVVQNGDTLGRIAQKFYKDARRADLIFQVNRQVLKDANHVRPGMKLVIPPM